MCELSGFRPISSCVYFSGGRWHANDRSLRLECAAEEVIATVDLQTEPAIWRVADIKVASANVRQLWGAVIEDPTGMVQHATRRNFTAVAKSRVILPRQLDLEQRDRQVVRGIRNADIIWKSAGFATCMPTWHGQSELASRGRPSIEALVDALQNDDQFIAAHLFLCEQFQMPHKWCEAKSDRYEILWNALVVKVSWTQTEPGLPLVFAAEYPDRKEQQSRLIRSWSEFLKGER